MFLLQAIKALIMHFIFPPSILITFNLSGKKSPRNMTLRLFPGPVRKINVTSERTRVVWYTSRSGVCVCVVNPCSGFSEHQQDALWVSKRPRMKTRVQWTPSYSWRESVNVSCSGRDHTAACTRVLIHERNSSGVWSWPFCVIKTAGEIFSTAG